MATAGNIPYRITDNTPQKLHQYDRLLHIESIRYFLLWPGTGPNLTISLITTDIDSLPEYSALSYAWGPPTRTNAIFVVNPITKESLGVLLVTNNLNDVLHKVRDSDKTVFLWADAVCINQDDPFERNHQVKQMARVYGNAHTVIVWLGQDEFDLGKKAFMIARMLAHNKTAQAYLDELLLDSNEFIPSNQDTKLNTMRWLIEREWFTRIWTMQEIGLAVRATVLCGNCSISWTDLSSAYGMLQRNIEYEVLQLLRFRPWLVTFLSDWKASNGLSFLETLDAARSRFTTNPRDRIYAMLTHPSARRKPSSGDQACDDYIVQPNYSQSVRDVFTDTAVQIILDTRSLDPLSYIRTDQLYYRQLISAGRQAMSSWVPDWREGRNTMQLFITHSHFMACGPEEDELNNQPPVFVQIETHYHLQAMAIHCGTVVKWCILDFPPEQDASHEVRRAWNEISAKADVETISTFGRVLCGGLMQPQHRGKIGASEISDSEFASFWRSLLHIAPVEDSELSSNSGFTHDTRSQGTPGSIWNQVFHACSGRKLFTTDTGYIGLGPSGLKQNDDVFVLSWGRVPFVLRRLGFETPRYFLVGECYVDGLMRGEASHSMRTVQHVSLW